MLKHERSFTPPLLLQRKTSLTNFDQSNLVFVNMIPFLYPVENIVKNEVTLKQLNNEIILANNINLRENDQFKTFLVKFLKKALSSNFPNINVKLLNLYNIKPKLFEQQNFMDQMLLNESLDFLENIKDDMKLISDQKERKKRKVENQPECL